MGFNFQNEQAAIEFVNQNQRYIQEQGTIQDEKTEKHILIYAIEQGWGQLVSKLIQAGADVNICDSEGITPLMYAVSKNNKDMVELLIQVGADVNAYDSEGMMPLMYAVSKNNKDMVVLLIQAGADVNACDREGITPLMYAAKNNKDMVVLLIQAGADVNVTNNPRVFPTNKGQKDFAPEDYTTDAEIRRIIVEQRKKIMNFWTELNKKLGEDIKQDELETFIQENLSMINSYVPEQDILTGDVVPDTKEVTTPLMFAIKNSKYLLIKVLLQKGANVNYGRYGKYPIGYALESKNADLLIYILNYGAKFDEDQLISFFERLYLPKDAWSMEDKKKILDFFVKNENFSLLDNLFVPIIASEKIDDDKVNLLREIFKSNPAKASETLIYFLDNIECIDTFNSITEEEQQQYTKNLYDLQLLVEAGADVNLQTALKRSDRTLSTLFQYAVTLDDVNIAKLFTQAGGNVFDKDLVFCKVGYESSHIVELREKSVNRFIESIMKNDIKSIKRQLEKDPSLAKAVNKNCETMIMLAARQGNKEVYDLLIANGANLWLTDSDGRGILLHAIEGGNNNIIEELKKEQLDWCSPDNCGITPAIYKIILNRTLTGEEKNKQIQEQMEKERTLWLKQLLQEHQDNVARQLLMQMIEKQEEQLNQALKAADIFAIKYKLEVSNAKVNELYEGKTLLYYAVENENIEAIMYLLKQDADVNAGVLPISVAVQSTSKKALQIVKMLIERGTNISDYPEKRVPTFGLWYWIRHPQIAWRARKVRNEIIKYRKTIEKFKDSVKENDTVKISGLLRKNPWLIKFGKAVETQGYGHSDKPREKRTEEKRRATPNFTSQLHDRVQKSNIVSKTGEPIEVDKLIKLINKGADVNVLIDNKPLLAHLVSFLIKRPDDQIRTLIKRVMRKGADVNIGVDGEPLITVLAKREDLDDLTKLAIEKGADLNVFNRQGKCAHSIVKKRGGDVKIRRALIENGANYFMHNESKFNKYKKKVAKDRLRVLDELIKCLPESNRFKEDIKQLKYDIKSKLEEEEDILEKEDLTNLGDAINLARNELRKMDADRTFRHKKSQRKENARAIS